MDEDQPTQPLDVDGDVEMGAGKGGAEAGMASKATRGGKDAGTAEQTSALYPPPPAGWQRLRVPARTRRLVLGTAEQEHTYKVMFFRLQAEHMLDLVATRDLFAGISAGCAPMTQRLLEALLDSISASVGDAKKLTDLFSLYKDLMLVRDQAMPQRLQHGLHLLFEKLHNPLFAMVVEFGLELLIGVLEEVPAAATMVWQLLRTPFLDWLIWSHPAAVRFKAAKLAAMLAGFDVAAVVRPELEQPLAEDAITDDRLPIVDDLFAVLLESLTVVLVSTSDMGVYNNDLAVGNFRFQFYFRLLLLCMVSQDKLNRVATHAQDLLAICVNVCGADRREHYAAMDENKHALMVILRLLAQESEVFAHEALSSEPFSTAMGTNYVSVSTDEALLRYDIKSLHIYYEMMLALCSFETTHKDLLVDPSFCNKWIPHTNLGSFALESIVMDNRYYFPRAARAIVDTIELGTKVIMDDEFFRRVLGVVLGCFSALGNVKAKEPAAQINHQHRLKMARRVLEAVRDGHSQGAKMVLTAGMYLRKDRPVRDKGGLAFLLQNLRILAMERRSAVQDLGEIVAHLRLIDSLVDNTEAMDFAEDVGNWVEGFKRLHTVWSPLRMVRPNYPHEVFLAAIGCLCKLLKLGGNAAEILGKTALIEYLNWYVVLEEQDDDEEEEEEGDKEEGAGEGGGQMGEGVVNGKGKAARQSKDGKQGPVKDLKKNPLGQPNDNWVMCTDFLCHKYAKSESLTHAEIQTTMEQINITVSTVVTTILSGDDGSDDGSENGGGAAAASGVGDLLSFRALLLALMGALDYARHNSGQVGSLGDFVLGTAQLHPRSPQMDEKDAEEWDHMLDMLFGLMDAIVRRPALQEAVGGGKQFAKGLLQLVLWLDVSLKETSLSLANRVVLWPVQLADAMRELCETTVNAGVSSKDADVARLCGLAYLSMIILRSGGLGIDRRGQAALRSGVEAVTKATRHLTGRFPAFAQLHDFHTAH